MQPNMLDDIFIKNLKNQSCIPSDITFNKDRILSSLQGRIRQKSNKNWKIAVAILIPMLGSSLYLHYQQYNYITSQQGNIVSQKNLISSLKIKKKQVETKNQILRDSLVKSNIALLDQRNYFPLPQLPTIVINQPIVFQNNVEDKLYIQITKRKQLDETEREIPELDLPVYYESDRLASNTSNQSKSKSLARKIGKLFKN
ncbi:hypothetical protein GCQ56_14430 [Marinifilum sp. N1E240]|uniref:hypothetical protein n=1 Tax=Marinifilum sp. N1E240 TaxID=2608082 RepID=UPI00128C6E65|nr:hypothetical protein [Marinifilum sp. N1E240]MPQ48198.1 hypothetical protein [Marinifilum sp. N1E240]